MSDYWCPHCSEVVGQNVTWIDNMHQNPDGSGCGHYCHKLPEGVADRIAKLEQKIKRVQDALEDGTPPGDCWVRKSTIRAALKDFK